MILLQIGVLIVNDTCSSISNSKVGLIFSLMFLISGSFGFYVSHNVNKCIGILHMILCIFSTFFSVALMAFAAIGIDDLRNPSQWFCQPGDKNCKDFPLNFAQFYFLFFSFSGPFTLYFFVGFNGFSGSCQLFFNFYQHFIFLPSLCVSIL